MTYRIYRDHWHHVTLVLHGRTDRLRHAYYLRSLALEPAAAKETRVFGLAGWLVDGYRQRWLTEMVDIWRARREGWALSVAMISGLAGLEALAIGHVAVAATAGHVSLATPSWSPRRFWAGPCSPRTAKATGCSPSAPGP